MASPTPNPHIWADVPQAELERRWQPEIGDGQIGGIDEAGRGPLAGPIVIGGVLLDPANYPEGLADSKKLSSRRRDELATQIRETAVEAFTIVCEVADIDRDGIQSTNLEALKAAARRLGEAGASLVLCDWYDIGESVEAAGRRVAVKSYPKGDARSLNIAAASILAKTVRDRLMVEADRTWPEYGFAQHKGYGTAAHRAALETHGLSPMHRRSFCSRYLDAP